MAGSSATILVFTIRDAEECDLPGILEIINEQIETSTAIFIDEPFDLDNRCAWMHELKAAGFPIFVAVSSEQQSDNDNNVVAAAASPTVLGFAYSGTFRPRWRYRFTVEETLYVHKSARGTGVGSALMYTLLAHAKKAGNVHVLVATITTDNLSSIRFHERFGFETVGTMREVGNKFGRWQDMIFMQLILS